VRLSRCQLFIAAFQKGQWERTRPVYMIALNRRVHDRENLEAYWKAAGPTFEGRGDKLAGTA
jgi:hypothetical protein